jgi:hypothetical protein
VTVPLAVWLVGVVAASLSYGNKDGGRRSTYVSGMNMSLPNVSTLPYWGWGGTWKYEVHDDGRAILPLQRWNDTDVSGA